MITMPKSGLWRLARPQSKIKRMRRDKYKDLAREQQQKKTKHKNKQTMEHEGDGDTNCN